MTVKSENRILFHHSDGKNEPVLGTNTCEIFYREQKSIKMHYKKPLNDYRKAVICIVFFGASYYLLLSNPGNINILPFDW